MLPVHRSPRSAFPGPARSGKRGALDTETVILVLFVGLIGAAAVPWFLSRRPGSDTTESPGAIREDRKARRSQEQVRRLPTPQQALSIREMRRQLEEAGGLLSRDLARARHFSMRNDAVVQADFALGDNRWTMRSTAAGDADTTASLLILSPRPDAGGSWRFLSARQLDGNPAAPNFVFFPDGTAQGGQVAMGWEKVRAEVSLTTGGAHRIDYDMETAKP